MPDLSSAYKEQIGYFHALGKVATKLTNFYVFNSNYKSAHNVRDTDVWVQSVPYAADVTTADSNASTYPSIIQKYTNVALTQITGSNGQAWYLDDSGSFVRPWISPVDVVDGSNNASYGYIAKIRQGSGGASPGAAINPSDGAWVFDYYAGQVLFQEGYTPSDQNWGIPEITLYAYVGSRLSDITLAAGAGTPVENELLAYQVSGTYTLAESDLVPNSSKLYLNGQKLTLGEDYTEDGNDLVVTTAVIASDTLTVDYRIE